MTRINGKPLVYGEDGLIHGEPFNISDEQRARLPKLEPLGDGPHEATLGYGSYPTREE